MRQLDGITNSMDEFGQAPGVGEGQGSLVCCNPWGRKQPDMTEQHTDIVCSVATQRNTL